jgi:hypothetical protein
VPAAVGRAGAVPRTALGHLAAALTECAAHNNRPAPSRYINVPGGLVAHGEAPIKQLTTDRCCEQKRCRNLLALDFAWKTWQLALDVASSCTQWCVPWAGLRHQLPFCGSFQAGFLLYGAAASEAGG